MPINTILVFAEFPSLLGYDIVFALSLSELDDGQTLLCCESFQRGNETPADRTHQRPRWQRLTTIVAEKSHNSQFGLEPHT